MSLKKFMKNWTLPVAIATGAIVYFVFHFVPALHGIAEWYEPINRKWVLTLCTPVVLFVTFSKIDFKCMRPVKWHLWLSLIQIFIIAVVMGIICGLGLEGNDLTLWQATLVCVLSPCATAAAVVTAKLGGNLEQMTAYTLLSNILTALLIPTCFMLLPHQSANIEAGAAAFIHLFLAILWKVSAVLLLPMVLSLLSRWLLPRFHYWVTHVPDLSFYLWAIALVVVTGTTCRNIMAEWGVVPPGLLLSIAVGALTVCVVQFAVGRFFGRYFGHVLEMGQGLGQKNTTFGIWAATVFLNPLSSVGPGCYILWQNIVNSLEIWMTRRHGELHTT